MHVWAAFTQFCPAGVTHFQSFKTGNHFAEHLVQLNQSFEKLNFCSILLFLKVSMLFLGSTAWMFLIFREWLPLEGLWNITHKRKMKMDKKTHLAPDRWRLSNTRPAWACRCPSQQTSGRRSGPCPGWFLDTRRTCECPCLHRCPALARGRGRNAPNEECLLGTCGSHNNMRRSWNASAVRRSEVRGHSTFRGRPAVGPDCLWPWRTSSRRCWCRRNRALSSRPPTVCRPYPWTDSHCSTNTNISAIQLL